MIFHFYYTLFIIHLFNFLKLLKLFFKEVTASLEVIEVIEVITSFDE